MRLDWTPGIALLLVVFIFLLSMARRAAGWVLDYQWWREMGQVETLINMVLYSVLPQLAVTLVGFVSLWIAHARGMKAAGTRLGEHPLYAKASVLGALFLAYVCSSMTASSWSAVLFLGGRQLPAEAAGWHDPVFQKPLSFYLFELPFYDMMLGVLLILTIVSGLAYAGAFLFWSAKLRGPRVLSDGSVEWPEFDFGRILHSSFTKAVLVLFLITFAAERFLDRYDLLTGDHGFMVGVDYIDEHIKLPLRWLTIAATLASIGLVITSKWRVMAISLVAVILVEKLVPTVVHGVYVRPNEISLEKPYIQRHIAATRSAFTLDRRAKEFEHKARLDARIDPNKNKAIFDNVRLWDWRAFHDTVTQIQALRPYYVFHGTDVDRYQLDGELRQVLLTPRELDVRQLPPDARSRWMNPHFIYTHGYGMVLAEANKITPDGLPVLYIQNAPAEVKTKDLRLTRPEIYYGEIAHEPIFVRSGQPEFNYPSGAENVHTRYEGKGGFPIASLALRLAATVAHADWNILLTGFLTGESRMMIRRNVHARVEELAGFLHWDPDAYMVITPEGRLVWMMDGYTKSDAHPYSLRVRMGGETVNYLRNAVKATVDAYDGEIRFYIFDEQDPIIRAYAALFPKLFRKAAEMPPSLREHARYPLTQFQVQAEIYRTFHMRDAEAFYNKEDAWDLARAMDSQDGKPERVTPTYVVTTLPGETKPEFLLITSFTPRSKDNLIGVMAARCDGEHLGELVFLHLSKQELIFGPLQISARINQDQNISKDLTLWNQQGSRVLNGQMLVLPVEDTFAYVQPIYIQSSQARMPQLKKVAIAIGNQLVYADTYEQALAQLGGLPPAAAARPTVPQDATAAAAKPPPPLAPATSDQRIGEIRRHMQRYRELSSQGKFVEAAKELEALEGALKR